MANRYDVKLKSFAVT